MKQIYNSPIIDDCKVIVVDIIAPNY